MVLSFAGAFAPQDLSMLEIIGWPLPEDKSNMSEDCLFLNVWTSNITPKKPMPVMVVIHEGGFHGGKIIVYSKHNTFYMLQYQIYFNASV